MVIKTNTSDWLTIDTYNGWLNGIPSVNDAGTYWVNVTVTDGENGWDFHNFTLKVLKKAVQFNTAPQLLNASMTPKEGDVKTEFTFSVNYYDEDGDVPVFIQLVIGDATYNIKLKSFENTSNGTYEYKITLPEGTHNYYFIAFDGSETVKTNNMTTAYIKKIAGVSTEETFWFWLFLVVIIIMIIAFVIPVILDKKRKAVKITTVQAEILQGPPEHIALPTTTPIVDIATPLAAQPIVSEQLPSPTVQVQPSVTIPTKPTSTPTLAPITMEPQFQLPKATLSKTQKLELLKERFLRDEADQETYKELEAEIKSNVYEDITMIEEKLKTGPTTNEQQKFVPTKESIESKASTFNTPEFVDKHPQQLSIESKISQSEQYKKKSPQSD